jgi:hypothetical protein
MEEKEQQIRKELFQTDEYNNRWREVNDALFFYTTNFVYNPNVVLLDLDDCLVKREPNTFFYKRNQAQLPFYSDEFVQILSKMSQTHSLVIMTQTLTGALKIDILKKKVRVIAEVLPVLCLATKNPDGRMKPHTGFFRVLRTFFARQNAHIKSVTVIGNDGGIVENDMLLTPDTDRAFAHNIKLRYPDIQVDYFTIPFFMGDGKPALAWDPSVIAPEFRHILIEEFNSRKREGFYDMLEKTFGLNHDVYAFFIMGPPSSGKTRLARKLKKELRKNKTFSGARVIKKLQKSGPKTRFNEFRKLLDQKFSVIVDGGCHTSAKRAPYFALIRKEKIPTIFINLCTGLHTSKLFNHVAAEMNELSPIKKFNDFRIYASEAISPADEENIKVINYFPKLSFKSELHKEIFLKGRF